MDLREALSVLSKSSPYAVTAEGEPTDSEFEQLKKCLYVETDIERAFKTQLERITNNQIIFLCGSSGDGKSEILTRYKKQHEQYVDFHLDATHSFEHDKNAIETLDSVFTKHATSNRALVVGINIGMLGNYEREGSEEHQSIKEAISGFLAQELKSDQYVFLDFESFPKFTIENGRVTSPFFSKLLDNVVRDDSSNKFRDYFNLAYGKPANSILCANYLMLRNRHVQSVIINLLLSARIRKDQFITARMLLDFIHSILTGPDYLFDNVFNGGDNELLDAIAEFDPSVLRNKALDLLILHRTLNIEDQAYDDFLAEISSRFSVANSLDPKSLVRMFFIFKDFEVGNNYHMAYSGVFEDAPMRVYKKIWAAHKNYDGDADNKRALKSFYSDVVLKAINKYANRSAHYLSKDEFYLSSRGGMDLAAEVEINVVYKALQQEKNLDLSAFNMYLEVAEEKLLPIPVGVNLLELMLGIVNGYRPNRYDKNSVVLLDELISKISETANATDTLFLHNNGDRIKLKAASDNEIRVSGL